MPRCENWARLSAQAVEARQSPAGAKRVETAACAVCGREQVIELLALAFAPQLGPRRKQIVCAGGCR